MGDKKTNEPELTTTANEADGVTLVVVDREQLKLLRRLLEALPGSKGEEGHAELSWAVKKANEELQAIQHALQQTGGNITRAARLLGIHRTTLWRKLKRLREGK